MTRFEKFLSGLQRLQHFNPRIDFDNIKQSAPFSGEPEHSYTSYCIVEVNHILVWDYIGKFNLNFRKEMADLGWRSEQEDCYWIFM